MKTILKIFVACNIFSSAFAGDAVKFDNSKPIKEMLLVLRDQIQKGEKKVVKFSSGEFHLVSYGEDNGGPVVDHGLAVEDLKVNISAGNRNLEVSEWIKNNKVKWVTITIDTDLASNKFFQLEKVLRKQGVKYILSMMDASGNGSLILRYSSGPPTIPSLK